jgi:NAD(P)-dependent dehydrogenase (short-subunit alcohol dehydrogenase family)
MSYGLPDGQGRLHGKSAIVTGGGRGIGKAITERFALEGARVMIAEIDAPVGQQAAEELGALGLQVATAAVDVAEPEQIHALVSRTVQQFGKLDVLVNNAAIASFPFKANLSVLPLSSWHTMMKKNLDSVMLTSQAASQAMISGGGGYIVNLSSILHLLGGVGVFGLSGGKRRGRHTDTVAGDRPSALWHRRQCHCTWMDRHEAQRGSDGDRGMEKGLY